MGSRRYPPLSYVQRSRVRIHESAKRESRFPSCGEHSSVRVVPAFVIVAEFRIVRDASPPNRGSFQKKIGLQVAASGFLRRDLLGKGPVNFTKVPPSALRK
jgi:hypothetical protein